MSAKREDGGLSDWDSIMATHTKKAKKPVSQAVLDRLAAGRAKRAANLAAKKGMVAMPEAAVAQEHKTLPEVLASGTPAEQKAEAADQAQEGQQMATAPKETCPTCGTHIPEGTIASRLAAAEKRRELTDAFAAQQAVKAEALKVAQQLMRPQ